MRAVLLLPLLLLAAGTAPAQQSGDYSGPSEADIRAAYELKLKQINDATRRFLDQETAAKLRVQLNTLDFIECDPIDQHADHYRCSVLVESRVGTQAPKAGRVEIVLFKEGDVWKAM